MGAKRMFWLALVAAVVCAAGCGSATFEADDIGIDEDISLTMDLPEGWLQGEPRSSGGFFRTSKGTFLFEDADKDYPMGSVVVFPLEGDTLEDHVKKAIEQEKALTGAFQSLVTVAAKMAGAEAEAEAEKARASLETDISEPAEVALQGAKAFAVTYKTPEIVTYRVFATKGAEVVEVMFQAEAAQFAKYEEVFHATAASIRLR